MIKDPLDPRGLIHEAYQIDGIDVGQCRSIFLDWALAVPDGVKTYDQVKALLVQYAEQPVDHPMTQVFVAALADMPTAQRRGGRAARISGAAVRPERQDQ